jgi:hypothetical protein
MSIAFGAAPPWGKCYHHPFTAEETKAWSGRAKAQSHLIPKLTLSLCPRWPVLVSEDLLGAGTEGLLSMIITSYWLPFPGSGKDVHGLPAEPHWQVAEASACLVLGPLQTGFLHRAGLVHQLLWREASSFFSSLNEYTSFLKGPFSAQNFYLERRHRVMCGNKATAHPI